MATSHGLGCRWKEKNVYGDMVERRTLKTPDGRFDPLLVPPEWSQWLKNTRREAPSPDEVLRCALVGPGVHVRTRLVFTMLETHGCAAKHPVYWLAGSACNNIQ